MDPLIPFPTPSFSRRDFVRVCGTAALSGLILGPRGLAATQPAAELHLPLHDTTGLNLQGPHRFLTIAGQTCFQTTSLKTKATLSTTLHRGPTGALSSWFSPRENAEFYSLSERAQSIVSEATVFPLVSDASPPRDRNQMTFGIYWTSGYPQFVGKFAGGGIWEQLDFGLAPFVYAERLSLRAGAWYHVMLSWDKPRTAARLHRRTDGVRRCYRRRLQHRRPSAQLRPHRPAADV